MSKIQYRYAQFIQKNGSIGVAAFAFINNKQDNKDKESLDYSLGVSFCSPKDFFIKSIGRAKAEHRLGGKRTKKPIVGSAIVDKSKKNISNKDFWGILTDAIDNNSDQFPRWAMKAWDNGTVLLTTSPLEQADAELEKTERARYLRNAKPDEDW